MKLLNEWGVLLKEEASYGAGGSVSAATDGILVLDRPRVPVQHVHGGQRRGERGPMNTGIKRVARSGRFGEVTLAHEGAGAGAAYAAGVKPSFHTLLRLCGFDATLDATGGSEKYTYALGAGASGLGEFYDAEHKVTLHGILGDLTITADGPEVPAFEVPLMGFMPSLPAESAVPAITYPSVSPPKADPIVLTMGDFAAAVVRSFTFALNRERTPRLNQNHGASNAHVGFAGGARRPTLEVLIETPAFTTTPFHAVGGMNAYQLAELATALTIGLQVGATQYNRYTINAANAQLMEDPQEEEDGAVALWRLQWELNPSVPGLKDNCTIVAD